MIHRALFGIDRALLRHPLRALRRRVPGLARAGAGDGPARSPTATSDYARARSSERCRPTAGASSCVDAHADTLGRAHPPGQAREGPVRARGRRRRRRARHRRRERAGERRARARRRRSTTSSARLAADVDSRVVRLTPSRAMSPRSPLGGLARRRTSTASPRSRRPSGPERVPVRRLAAVTRRRVARARAQRARVRGDERVPVHVRSPDGRAAAPRVDPRRPVARRGGRGDGADAGRQRRGAAPRTGPTASTSAPTSGAPRAPACPVTCTCTCCRAGPATPTS